MAFEVLDPRMQLVAQRSLAECRNKYGSKSLKIELGLAAAIQWRPTFFLKPSKFEILAVEVSDILYPESLRGAASEIMRYHAPICVYQACSTEAFLTDKKQHRTKLLKENGFGLITVDVDGDVHFQHSCVALAQHISNSELDDAVRGVPQRIKQHFQTAYQSYCADPEQGLQRCGQIVEGVMQCLIKHAIATGNLPTTQSGVALANQIDALYGCQPYHKYRAQLGGARQFVQSYRNPTSHAPRTAQEAHARFRLCRKGFMEAVNIVIGLLQIAKSLNVAILVHLR